MIISHTYFSSMTGIGFRRLATVFCVFIAALGTISVAKAQFWNDKKIELLPEDQAFSVLAEVEGNKLNVNWSIAEDYYMYRDNFKIEVNTPGVEISDITFPEGTIEDDPEFGKVEVYFYNASLTANIIKANVNSIELVLFGQGCNKPVGVCYPPMRRIVDVQFSGVNDLSGANNQSSSEPIESTEPEKSFISYILAALGAGLLLSFTPCVLPMIPILAGVIAGQQNPSKWQSGWLAICYVAGTVVTYLIAGWLAGATGAQLQAYFQNPWVIGFICSLLFLLAASLFGWFKIQLPSSVQSALSGTQLNSRSASLSSFLLGLVSALVVGACVSPVLIIALGAAITQGDPVLGAAIMGSMAIGMGSLLILFGFGAGWILPKAGPWMQQVQVIFGLMVLGVAIYLIDTLAILPILYLWAALLLLTGVYLWHISRDISKPLVRSLFGALSLATVIWGVMAIVGGSTNGTNILQPLENLSTKSAQQINSPNSDRSSLPFTTVTTLAETQTLLAQATQANKRVLIDFYADWCLDCKRMHRTTFKQSSVARALEDWVLIEIDVTETSKASETVKRFFNVFGPPATLFIKANGQEHADLRQYGYLNEADFLTIINKAG